MKTLLVFTLKDHLIKGIKKYTDYYLSCISARLYKTENFQQLCHFWTLKVFRVLAYSFQNLKEVRILPVSAKLTIKRE
jgi:hypothetical protein